MAKSLLPPLALLITLTLTGCSDVSDSDDDLGYKPAVHEAGAVREDTEAMSSQILDIIGIKGKVTEPGPGVTSCAGMDPQKFFKVRHPWSLYGVPVPDLRNAMDRLKTELPRHNWKITSYGPDKSRAKSLTLYADSTKKKFTVQIKLLDRRGRSENPSGIMVTLVSGCFQVPKGQQVSDS